MMRNRLSAFLCALSAFAFFACMNASQLSAQQQNPDNDKAQPASSRPITSATSASPKPVDASSGLEVIEGRLKALEQIIERQQREIQTLRELLESRDRADANLSPSAASHATTSQPAEPAVARPVAQADNTQKRVDELYKKFGAIRFSGDLRFRAETFRNQGFDALTESPDRNRLRVRARLALDGTINKNFDWGLRLATGTYTNPVSSNQTFTDFFERKPFDLDRAFVRYDSKSESVGVQLIAGKFEPTFRRTQMVWDDDVSVEGASEALYFKTKSPLKQIKLVAFQLPFNEVTGDKDGIVYGGQLQADWQAGTKVIGNVNVSYYDWNHADQVVLALGASATQVNGGILNGSGTTGNQNGALGTTNRIVRNAAGQPVGFLAQFKLVDFLGNLTWQATNRFPITFTVDFVHNATDRVRDEKNGYWVGAVVGQAKEKGDWLLGYYYTRIEQDAVLVPFNFDDILASNSRVHMPTIAYQVASGVTLQWTGLFSQRANKIVLLSPENRFLNRMQFDVIYKF